MRSTSTCHRTQPTSSPDAPSHRTTIFGPSSRLPSNFTPTRWLPRTRSGHLRKLCSQMGGKEFLHLPPHLLAQHVPRFLLDEPGRVFFGVHGLIGFVDGFNPAADFVDGAAAVKLAEVQVERPGSDEGGDVRRVAVLMQAGDEVGKAVEHLLAMDAGVSR